ncbi:glutamyl-Q tRNA(Asp) synthetase [Planctomycetota bacterium]|nr:glutamyl-Q tRNA(Asp) synthetase [Planctomycetota bacterium]
MATSRFAPTASGRAHPGTLLAGLLAWLDARRSGARLILRIEDIDRERCTPALAAALIGDLDWFGLDFDAVERQSEHAADHLAALERLAALGRLYPSTMSRRQVTALGRRAPDGGWAYDNSERDTPLPDDWRSADIALRVRLPEGRVAPVDEGGVDLEQNPAQSFGDPVVRTRSGGATYHLAVVVDDHHAGVDRIVRGRDLATASATQAALRRLLGWPDPVYRHHLLVLESDASGKLAKSHGSISGDELRQITPERLCGELARLAGLADTSAPCRPRDLLDGFCWQRISPADAVWDHTKLRDSP